MKQIMKTIIAFTFVALVTCFATEKSMAAIAFVQSAKTLKTTTSTTVSATLNGVTAGNFLVAVVMCSNSGAGCSYTQVSDGTNSFTKTPNSPAVNSTAAMSVWITYLPNVSGGNTTVTFTHQDHPYGYIWLAEFSGVATNAPLDVDASFAGATSSTNINSPSITTTVNGALIVGGAGAEQTITSANGSWIGTADIVNGNSWAYQVQTAAGSIAADWTQSPAGQWAGVIAAFKPSASTRVRRRVTQD